MTFPLLNRFDRPSSLEETIIASLLTHSSWDSTAFVTSLSHMALTNSENKIVQL